MAVIDVTSRVAPGQTAILSQGKGQWREVKCLEAREDRLVLVASKTRGVGDLVSGRQALFQTLCDTGVLRCSGELTTLRPLEWEFRPNEAPLHIVNRRESFRVSVTARAELAGIRLPSDEPFSVQWPVSLRDVSLGGARLMAASPPPLVNSSAMLRIELPTGEKSLVLPSRIVESAPRKHAPPFDALVRLKFQDLPARLENQLGRYVNWLQIDLLRKGVR